MKLDELREMVKEVLQEENAWERFLRKEKERVAKSTKMLPSLPRQKQGPDEIQKVDRDKLKRQGKRLVDLEARTEEEARGS